MLKKRGSVPLSSLHGIGRLTVITSLLGTCRGCMDNDNTIACIGTLLWNIDCTCTIDKAELDKVSYTYNEGSTTHWFKSWVCILVWQLG